MQDATTTEVAAPVVETEVVTPEVQTEQEAPIATSESEQPLMIPEKFRGKDLKDVVNSYVNVEKQWRQTQNTNKELEERAIKAEQQAALLQQQQTQVQPQPIHSTTPEISEEEQFMKDWEENPATATLKRTQRAERKIDNHQRNVQTTNYYNQVKTQLPDFVELEPVMIQLAQQAASFVSPDKLNSPEMVNALYLMARGQAVDTRLAKAKENGIQEAKQLNREKAAAFSEGTSAPGKMTRFDELSLEEMRALLPKVERD